MDANAPFAWLVPKEDRDVRIHGVEVKGGYEPPRRCCWEVNPGPLR